MPRTKAKDSGLGLGETSEREVNLERECGPGKGTREPA